MFWFVLALAKGVVGVLVWLALLFQGQHLPSILPPALRVAMLGAFVGGGAALVAGSRKDVPARSLGMVFCLFGSIFADPLLAVVPHDSPAWILARDLVLAISPVTMVPLYFWRFAWEFPRRQP
ncbi:MAG TPA: hypothetical protein VH439_00380, partial [Gemmatimonadales bacterium]